MRCVVVMPLVFAIAAAGCGSQPVVSPAPSVADGDRALLLTYVPDPGAPEMEAQISGVLRVTPAGCVALSGLVIVVPAGSTIDGDRVHLEGYGDFVLGDDFTAGGGSYSTIGTPLDRLPAGVERCRVTELTVINPA